MLERDGNGKPLKVIPLNWDPYETTDTQFPSQQELYNRYGKGKVPLDSNRNPAFIVGGNKGSGIADMDDMLAHGWKPVSNGGGNGKYGTILF